MYLSDLRPLYAQPGPWVSVYLDASRSDERGAEAVGLRWRAAREALTAAGARQEVLSGVEGAISDDLGGEHGLAVFAGPSGVAHVEALPRPPALPIAEVGPLPHVMPMLEQRGEQVSWLRVLVDRTGADIERAAVGRAHRYTTLEGPEEYPLSKNKPGGWSAPRYENGVEITWGRNTGAVASAAAEMAERAGAEVLILAGDVRARHLVEKQLPNSWRGRTVQSEGSRAGGADPRRLDEQTHRAVAEVAQARVEEALDRLRVYSARDLTATGLGNVVSALQRGNAETVVLEPSKLDSITLWVGPEPAYLATTEGELRRLGVAEPQLVRADDAIVRSAAATGAELFLAQLKEDEGDRDGAAVLLRGSP